ncbi:MAG: N-methylproline demethylase, partial [Amphritea sp.]|nr:N-methylproline demethylase [Amphritea sp.]
SWDILSRSIKPGSNVLLFDDAGDHAALQAAEVVANSGAKLEIITPDRSFAPEVMAMNLVPYMRTLQQQDVTFTVTYRLKSVSRDGDQLLATIGSDYDDGSRDFSQTRRVDQVIINHGTLPFDDLYFELRALASNEGEVNYNDLIDGKPQTLTTNNEGQFQLFRIGDAISARNTHAAIYDALRLVKDL